MLAEKYIPVACSFYDELERLATIRKKVSIIYKNDDASEELQDVLIFDFKTTTDGEYLFAKADNEQYRIRLDQIITVDGIHLSDYKDQSCGLNS
jgi:Rho-binding antiterminator